MNSESFHTPLSKHKAKVQLVLSNFCPLKASKVILSSLIHKDTKCLLLKVDLSKSKMSLMASSYIKIIKFYPNKSSYATNGTASTKIKTQLCYEITAFISIQNRFIALLH